MVLIAVTIKEIAQRAGVSVSAVSLVLNDKPIRISPEKRALVKQIAKELDYTPNPFAVSFKRQISQTLGLIIPDVTNPFFSALAKGALVESRKSGYDLLFSDSSNNAANDYVSLRNLTSKGVRGIIIALSAGSEAEIRHKIQRSIQKLHIPVVLVDRDDPFYNCSAVVLNHIYGAYLATRHLIELGHTRIGCITGPLDLKSASDRYAGYQKALAEHGIPLDKALVRHGDYGQEDGRALCADLLGSSMTALFACNDMMALGAYQTLAERGLKVPRDLSVVGFDDIPFAAMMEVPLTTIRQPVREMGHRALQVVLQRLDDPTLENNIVLFEPALVVRESTALPKERT